MDTNNAAAENIVTIGLPHMDVVLSLSIGPDDQNTGEANSLLPPGFDVDPADPVMGFLFRQLEASGNDEDLHGVHSDTIRLALIARWLATRFTNRRPEDKGSITPLPKWRIRRVAAYIEDHIDELITLSDLAGVAGLSRMHFAAQFRAATGLRPHDYLLRCRVERAKSMLCEPGNRLVEIALNVGFQTQAHFTTVFKRFVGTTPARWRAMQERSPREMGAVGSEPFQPSP
ncbi:helix-turn-helix domain-containing protein [Martelella soudanensis]|uniref:helix-turn-helix domain-containing protein n=1 Tax=unclassified Martelella TaxID=2629616 RepID=UPI00353038F2